MIGSAYPPMRGGEPAWPPLAMFKAVLLSIWYDFPDVKLVEMLEDRASFRRFCGFLRHRVTCFPDCYHSKVESGSFLGRTPILDHPA